ncbi:jg12944 [Pararge aegeria aegeria]|uniref:NADH dehydrogenase [ubiquinone] 1 beta subcomplex subunit 4 n=1 Tax=Pararge aegeria aegeria TaxID=348720 RepID=A0A8S4SGS9_9NEOP|nr:jg12944 [Pararge aegeria aegeria]
MDKCGFSDTECKIILAQIERRAKYRKEFLKLRTDPCMHSREAGYVFDPALQRWLSMKTCQYDYFKATPKTALFGFMTIVGPMLVYGYAVWRQRTKFLDDCRSGRIRYRDRIHKLA